METLLLVVALAASNIVCFTIGAKVGQAVIQGKPVKLPEVNPVKAVQEYKAAKEEKMEQDRLSVIVQNMENYDGSGNGQKAVPRR